MTTANIRREKNTLIYQCDRRIQNSTTKLIHYSQWTHYSLHIPIWFLIEKKHHKSESFTLTLPQTISIFLQFTTIRAEIIYFVQCFTFISPSADPVTKNSSSGSKARHLMEESWAWNVCLITRWRMSNIQISPLLPPLISCWWCGACTTAGLPCSWQVNAATINKETVKDGTACKAGILLNVSGMHM